MLNGPFGYVMGYVTPIGWLLVTKLPDLRISLSSTAKAKQQLCKELQGPKNP